MAAGLGEQLGEPASAPPAGPPAPPPAVDLRHDLGSMAALAALYAPYCDGINRAARLEQALELLARGRALGRRVLRPQGAHDFEFSWSAASSPQEASGCILRFPALPEVSYTFSLPTYLLVRWLMDLLEAQQGAGAQADLPEAFWRWLLVGALPPAAAT